MEVGQEGLEEEILEVGVFLKEEVHSDIIMIINQVYKIQITIVNLVSETRIIGEVGVEEEGATKILATEILIKIIIIKTVQIIKIYKLITLLVRGWGLGQKSMKIL